MKENSEVFAHFQKFKAMVEKKKGMQIKCLRSDGGGEYFSNEFTDFLREQGIKRVTHMQVHSATKRFCKKEESTHYRNCSCLDE